MLLKDKGNWCNSFHNFSFRWFLCCDSNLDLQSNLPILGARLIVLKSFFLWKMLDIVLEYWKLLKLYFIIGKTFRLLVLYVIVKGIISSFFVAFGCLKISRGIFVAFKMLVSISDLLAGYFVLLQCFFQFFKAFSFYIFIFNNGTYSSCKTEQYLY